MTKNSTKPSLTTLPSNVLRDKPTAQTSVATERVVYRYMVLNMCERYKNNKPKLAQYLRALFKRRENIHLFGWFINQRYVELETPQFHREILSDVSDVSNKFIGVAAPRGHAKSTTVDFTYALWATVYPQESGLHFGVIVSDTVTQAIEFVNSLKDQFETNVIMRWLYGDLTSSEWRDGEFVTSTGIKWLSKGTGMKLRGLRYREHRPDLIIFDDIENDERVATAEQRKKLKNWFTKAALPALARDGRAIIIGTILHHDSLLNNIINHREMFAAWKTRLYRAIMVDKSGKENALWPEHINLENLKRMRDDPKYIGYIGSLAFAQEYQNKPFDESDAIIQPAWVKWAPARPDIRTVVASVLTVDPAASEKTKADPTGKIFAELTNEGNVYIGYVGNKRLSPKKNADELDKLNGRYNPNAIGIEGGVLGLVFRDLLAGLPVIGVKADTDKVRRLLAVARFFEAGQVFFVEDAPNINALYDQLIEFPSGSHDDMVDALVYAIRMLLVDGINTNEDFDEAGTYDVNNDDDEFDEEKDNDRGW